MNFESFISLCNLLKLLRFNIHFFPFEKQNSSMSREKFLISEKSGLKCRIFTVLGALSIYNH